jgi:hypothetical protein
MRLTSARVSQNGDNLRKCLMPKDSGLNLSRARPADVGPSGVKLDEINPEFTPVERQRNVPMGRI